MKTQEIRLGNYFMYDSKEVYIAEILKEQNVVIYDGHGLDKGAPLDMLRPILLTEEMLIRFGFEKTYDSHIRKVYDLIKDDSAWSVSIAKTDKTESYFEIKGRRIKPELIKYIHQLQNLYFALTGEELKITAQ